MFRECKTIGGDSDSFEFFDLPKLVWNKDTESGMLLRILRPSHETIWEFYNYAVMHIAYVQKIQAFTKMFHGLLSFFTHFTKKEKMNTNIA